MNRPGVSSCATSTAAAVTTTPLCPFRDVTPCRKQRPCGGRRHRTAGAREPVCPLTEKRNERTGRGNQACRPQTAKPSESVAVAALSQKWHEVIFDTAAVTARSIAFHKP